MLSPALVQEALELARHAAAALAPTGARVQVAAGDLDRRLQLAPCTRVVPYLPAGVPSWGATRVGLRCATARPAWNVFLPISVQVLAPGLALRGALPAGARITRDQLVSAEIDWTAAPGAPFLDPSDLDGRVLARPIAAGQAPRPADLQARQWFASGQVVRVVAVGAGFAVAAEGQALGPGLEGQSVRVRTDGGRIVVGRAVAAGRVEIPL